MYLPNTRSVDSLEKEWRDFIIRNTEPYSHLMQSEIIIYGLVRKCVKLSPSSQIIFIIELALNYIDKL